MIGTGRAPRPGLYFFLVAAAAFGAALGFVREASLAAFFGASTESDAFYFALAVPFIASQFLVGGALVPPLTAALARALAAGDAEGARSLLGRALSALLGWGGLATLACAAFAGPLVAALGPGFGPGPHALAVSLFRLLLVYGLATSAALVVSAPLLAAGAWHVPPLALLAANAVSLAVLVTGRSAGIQAAAWAVDAGAVVQLLFLVPFVARLGLGPSFGPAGLRLPMHEVGLLSLSLLAAGAVDLAERSFASTAGAGSIALLALASKLVHLPMRLVAAPLASVLLPRLAGGEIRKEAGIRREARDTAMFVPALLLAATAATTLLAVPIVQLAFGRGRFTGSTAALVAVLRWLAPGILAVGLVEIGSKFLLAERRSRLVALAQGSGLAVYLVAAPLLVTRGVNGLALARALAWSTVAALLLVAILLPTGRSRSEKA